MAFLHDFRRIATRDALITAMGTDEATFDAVLDFDPPPMRTSEPPDTPKIAVLEIPMFFRHDIPKRNKARGYRTVWEPTLAKGEYKALARRLESFFRLTLPGFPHDSAFGYQPGRNIRENAAAHAGHRSLLRVDIRNFFPSISTSRVTALFETIGVDPLVADLLARFVTIGGALPLGLPTSPVLSNAIALPIDIGCLDLADQSGAIYTRYADDLSFSGDGKLPDVERVRSLVEDNGFALAEEKTHRSLRGQAHFVTGLSISDPAQPHVPKAKKRRLRQELHYARKFGLTDHLRHLGVNSDRLIQQQVNRLDGMVRFVAHHEPRLASTLKPGWKDILRDNGMKPSFTPRGQNRAPYYIFIDEAEFDRGGTRILALGLTVSQHAPRMVAESREVLEAALGDLWAAGDIEALRKRGLHYTDATEDLRIEYVKRLAAMRFEGYIAFAPYAQPVDYEDTYLRLMGAVIRRRLMAAESQFAFFFCERNDKVPASRIEACIQGAFDELKARDDRRPSAIGIEFVSKPNLGISAPDFLLGVLGRYLRSAPTAVGKPESRDRLMFERLRDRYKLILDLSTWTEYSRRRPIRPWSDE